MEYKKLYFEDKIEKLILDEICHRIFLEQHIHQVEQSQLIENDIFKEMYEWYEEEVTMIHISDFMLFNRPLFTWIVMVKYDRIKAKEK